MNLKKSTYEKNNTARPVLRLSGLTVAVVAAMAAGNAAATTEFELGEWQGNWTTTVSWGKSWRMQNPEPRLYTPGNGAYSGLTKPGLGHFASQVDEGDLNYREGDAFSELYKVISEVELKKGKAGALIRAKAWYDYALNNNSVRMGSQTNGWNGYANSAYNSLGLGGQTQTRPLSDKNLDSLVKFDGIELLDAYVYNEFDGIAGNPVQVRLGKQVLNWGESIFVQGLNQINPIDVPAFRRPGAELKEVFMPVWAISANQSLGEWGSLEAFYQLKYQSTPVDSGCGMYWSQTMGPISGSHAAGCDNVIGLGPLLASAVPALAAASAPYSYNLPAGFLSLPLPYQGLYVDQIRSPHQPENQGDWGVAYKFTSDALDTEFGFYYENLTPRLPVLSVNVNGWLYGSAAPGKGNAPISAFWEYPDRMDVFGISAATNILGWSVSGEFSQIKNFAAQVNGGDLLFAGLGASGLVAAQQSNFTSVSSVAVGPLGQRAQISAAQAQATGTGYLPGYVMTTKSQVQVNFLKAGNNILGANQYLFLGEVAYQWNDLNDYKNGGLRFGRGFIFGNGSSPTYGSPANGFTGNVCASGENNSADGCKNDGYVTKDAWGYRLMARLEYTNVFDTGVTVYPSIFFQHDVHGYSVDGQFQEDRKVTNLGLRFSYMKNYNLEFNYATYSKDATYNDLRDRDFFSANLSVTF